MHAKLPRLELLFYLLFWAVIFFNCIRHFYNYCRELESNKLFTDWALSPGFFLNFPFREKLDSDLTVIFDVGVTYAALAIVHVLFRRLIFGLLVSSKQALLVYLATFGFCAYTYVVGPYISGFFLSLVIVDWFLVNKCLALVPIVKKLSPLGRAWTVAIAQTLGMHFFLGDYDTLAASYYVFIAFIWSLGWYQLKLISYTDLNVQYRTSFLHFVAYAFYFPTIFAPFHSFARFLVNNDLYPLDKTVYFKNPEILTSFSAKVRLFVKQYLYVSFWLFLVLLVNHAFFPVGLAFYNEVYLGADIWARPGHAWVMGQWFQTKYMLLYGVPWLITFLDTGVPLPDVPVFVSRIYRYSVMWRRFDTGLYEFMRDHLYGPVLATLDWVVEHIPSLRIPVMLRKVFALGFTYGFVGIWHGLSSGVLIFAIMNYIGLIMEFTTAAISYKLGLAKKMSPTWYRRLTAFVCTFSVQWSWISFFFFMTDRTFGSFLVYNLYYHPFHLYCIAFVAMYCWVQLAMELEDLLDPPPFKKPQPNSQVESAGSPNTTKADGTDDKKLN